MSVVEAATPTAEDPWDRAQQLVERAELDVGAASLAAEAGDHDIAYALMTDAVAGWRQAVDLLLDGTEAQEVEVEAAALAATAVAAPETAQSCPDPEVVIDELAAVGEADPEAPTTTGAELFAELSVDLSAPAAVATVPVIDLREPAPAEYEVIDELDARAHEARRARFERARGRRRVPKGSTPSDKGGTVDPSERIASLVPAGGTAEDYQAWVDRLHERRHELKEAAGDIDLAAVHRSPMPPDRRRWSHDLTPPPW